jgi:hypothetical protein
MGVSYMEDFEQNYDDEFEDDQRCPHCDHASCVCCDAEYHCSECGQLMAWSGGENGKCFMCFELDGYQ